ncbi:MAG: hypothetical protein AAGF12_39060 [Myxococcota bacterium]
MIRTRVVTAMLAIVLLLVGMIAGALLMRAYDLRTAGDVLRKDPAGRRAAVLQFTLERRLDLDAGQRQALRDAIEAQREEVEALHYAQSDDRIRLRGELLERARTFLDASQFQEMERMVRAANERERVTE